ncbi:hypothetical protein ACLMJK_009607 [Lecanora helva]
MRILQDSAEDPESTLVQGGQKKGDTVNGLVIEIRETLNSLDKVASKYKSLVESPRHSKLWSKMRWPSESKKIEGFRTKRVETFILSVKERAGEISAMLVEQGPNRPSLHPPSISEAEDGIDKEALSAELMKNAEIFQPWSTTGIEQWIDSGRWWLSLDLSSVASKLFALNAHYPGMTALQNQDMRIWEDRARESLLRPRKDVHGDGRWKIPGNEIVLFQK